MLSFSDSFLKLQVHNPRLLGIREQIANSTPRKTSMRPLNTEIPIARALMLLDPSSP